MGDMEEIVTIAQAERLIRIVALALPVAGLVLGAVVGAVRQRLTQGVGVGVLCGLAGPAVWGLWRLYNGVIGVYGLDSVRGLLINLGLFMGIGLLVGLGVGIAWRRQRARERRGRPDARSA